MKTAVASKIDKKPASIPLGKLFETRGTLLHEMQRMLYCLQIYEFFLSDFLLSLVYKLAIVDLGRAAAMHPDRTENFFLKADCHGKLGNYEQVRVRCIKSFLALKIFR
jgi:hypothetical protein